MNELKSSLKVPSSYVLCQYNERAQSKDTEFHIYKPKQEMIFKIVFKYIVKDLLYPVKVLLYI